MELMDYRLKIGKSYQNSMGFLLFILSVILFLPLTVINIVLVLIKYTRNKSFLKVVNGYFLQTAIDIDRFGNHNLRTLLNLSLQKRGYKFGNFEETISSALGKNKRDATLTRTGKIVCNVLDFLDENHCLKSIKEFE